MPILDIEIVVSDPSSGLAADLTQTLADAAAQVFGSPPGTVWIKLRLLPSAQYAEDHGRPEGVYPVFVTVLKSRAPEGSELEEEIVRLTRAIAAVLNRPEENVHVFYQPDGAGRVAFGGRLVR
jgi:phenylpyruvate tautomerase PptA (4-oxalocrotonate tautomerase family)